MSFDLQSLPFICSNLQNEPKERSLASKPVSVFKERLKKSAIGNLTILSTFVSFLQGSFPLCFSYL